MTISAPLAAKLAELLPSDEELEETEEEKERFAKMSAPAPAAAPARLLQRQLLQRQLKLRFRRGLPVPSDPAPNSRPMTKDELIAEADDHDINVNTSWLKEDIIKALLRAK